MHLSFENKIDTLYFLKLIKIFLNKVLKFLNLLIPLMFLFLLLHNHFLNKFVLLGDGIGLEIYSGIIIIYFLFSVDTIIFEELELFFPVMFHFS